VSLSLSSLPQLLPFCFILLNAVLCNLFALGKFAPFGVGLVGLDRSGLLVVISGALARWEDGRVKNETAPKLQVG
jgi:hypothetical protein